MSTFQAAPSVRPSLAPSAPSRLIGLATAVLVAGAVLVAALSGSQTSPVAPRHPIVFGRNAAPAATLAAPAAAPAMSQPAGYVRDPISHQLLPLHSALHSAPAYVRAEHSYGLVP